jgi:trans-aconitate methyltransferase
MVFEFDGKRYEQASSHQKEWGARLIAELELAGSERVLDLGCGDGALTAQLADLVPAGSVVGLDSSPSMLAAARRRQSKNLSFELGDINALAFEAEFDLVFSNATLQWVKDHELLYRNVLHCLREGGLVRFNFAADGNCSNFIQVVRREMALPEFAGYFADFVWPWFMPDPVEYETLVRRFPFRSVRVWGENADRYFPNAEAMTRWIDQPSLVPFLARIEEHDRQAFRDHVVAKMIEQTLQKDGTCFETFRRVNVLARK